jgi:hypothetical protein
MQTWRTNSHNNALLRRVFTAACDSWRSSLGAAGYEADFSLLQRCLAAWQVASHVQLEERREGVLAQAAENTHERSLLTTAFTALRKEAQWAAEKENYLPLAHASLLLWWEATLTSKSHLASFAAQQHYEDSLKKKVLTVWSGHATAIACRVSVFYLKWQIDEKRRSVLDAWRHVIVERQKWEVRRAEAEELRSKHSFPVCSSSLQPTIAVNEVVVRLSTPANSAGTSNTSSAATGTTPSTGARSITPVMYASSGLWHSKAAEWRQRQELYSGGIVGDADADT